MLGLKPPVPTPIMMSAIMKQASTGDRGDDEEDVAEQCDRHRDTNRLVPTPVGVG